MPRSIKRALPEQTRQRILATYGSIHDLGSDYSNWLLGRRGKLTPPRHLFAAAGVGGRVSGFRSAGQIIFGNLVEIAGIRPDENILEIGCGIGRNAVPLTKYLNRAGKYEGFDVVPVSIGWCQSRITPKYSNFHFQLAHVQNEWYNPKGKVKASEYRFPYKSGTFDLVFLTSVFTHLIPEDLENYLSEIARVLRTEGRCMITYLLLNPDSQRFLDSVHYKLKSDFGVCKVIEVIDHDPPIGGTFYEEEYIKELYERFGLKRVGPVFLGNWADRPNPAVGQDIILARKVAD